MRSTTSFGRDEYRRRSSSARRARDLDLNALSERGVQCVGRLVGVTNGKFQFSGALRNACAMADLKLTGCSIGSTRGSHAATPSMRPREPIARRRREWIRRRASMSAVGDISIGGLGNGIPRRLSLVERTGIRCEGTHPPRRRHRRCAGLYVMGLTSCEGANRASSMAPKTMRPIWRHTWPVISTALAAALPGESRMGGRFYKRSCKRYTFVAPGFVERGAPAAAAAVIARGQSPPARCAAVTPLWRASRLIASR